MSDRSLDPPDWDEYRQLAHRVLDEAIEYLRTVRERPVWQAVPGEVKAELAAPIPVESQGLKSALEDCERLVLPYATGNIHPRFWGWVHGTGTPGGVLAQLLAATMNANVGGRDHGAVYVERQVISWFRELFGFPEAASGVLLSGTSMATLIGLAVARHARLPHVRTEGLAGVASACIYASTEAHASVGKAIELLGFGRRALRTVPSGADHRMDVTALQDMVSKDRSRGLLPLAVVATAGTVGTGAMDDLQAVADLCHREELWMHVDGAFGALVRLSPQLAHHVQGIERADSLAFDFHKWLHVPYEAGCVLVRDGALHRAAFSSSASYLARTDRGLSGGDPWFADFGIELSRSFRALPVWLTLKEHGARRFGEMIEQNCRQAAYLGALVSDRAGLELCAPVSLNIVCFRFVGDANAGQDLDALNAAIVADLQEQGLAAPSTTRLGGRLAIRVAITNHRSTQVDFNLLVDAVLRLGTGRQAGVVR
jgi:aromatic-L-amino-acid decarboxylase